MCTSRHAGMGWLHQVDPSCQDHIWFPSGKQRGQKHRQTSGSKRAKAFTHPQHSRIQHSLTRSLDPKSGKSARKPHEKQSTLAIMTPRQNNYGVTNHNLKQWGHKTQSWILQNQNVWVPVSSCLPEFAGVYIQSSNNSQMPQNCLWRIKTSWPL